MCDRLDSYSSVRRVKAQDDMFVTVSCLLDRVSDVNQVRSTVGFALDAIADMEAFDDDFAVHLKIAVDVGGRVYGRILNDMTPTFDLYGDAVDKLLTMRQNALLNSVRVGDSVRRKRDTSEFDIGDFESVTCPKTKQMIPTYQIYRKQ